MFEIKIIRSFAQVFDHSAAIDEFLKNFAGPNLYVSSDFLTTWLEVFPRRNARRQPHIPHIILIFNNSRLVGYCPLVLKKRGLKVVAQCAGEGLWGYSGIFFEENFAQTIFLKICENLIESGVSILSIGPLHEKFISRNSNWLDMDRGTLSPLEGAPCIEISGSFDAYIKDKPKGTFKNAARCWRNLNELGEVKIDCVKSDLEKSEIDELLENYFSLHIKQWKKSRFIRNKAWKKFYKILAYRMLDKGFLLHYLEIAGRKIAFHYGFRSGDRIYYFTPSYDQDYRKFSPGKILLADLIKFSYSKAQIFDFQNGEEPYKLDYANYVAARYQYEINLHQKGFARYFKMASVWLRI